MRTPERDRRGELGLRALALVAALALATGCGAHRIVYVLPSKADGPVVSAEQFHAHGIGPLVVGGGPAFFIVNELSPALVDHTGPIDARTVCPDGFARVDQHHLWEYGLNASVVSTLALVNFFHESKSVWSCLDSSGLWDAPDGEEGVR